MLYKINLLFLSFDNIFVFQKGLLMIGIFNHEIGRSIEGKLCMYVYYHIGNQ